MVENKDWALLGDFLTQVFTYIQSYAGAFKVLGLEYVVEWDTANGKKELKVKDHRTQGYAYAPPVSDVFIETTSSSDSSGTSF